MKNKLLEFKEKGLTFLQSLKTKKYRLEQNWSKKF